MKRPLLAILCIGIMAMIAQAQSGRRLAVQPTPAPPAVEESKPQFSDSKPQAPRRIRHQNRFPTTNTETTARAQNPSTTDAEYDGEIVKVETDLITIPVSVFDRNGLYIPGLRQQNFKIFEDGVEQEIAYFGTTDKPFTVILLIDTSPSTAYKIEEIQQAATAFVDQLKPQDSVMVIEFASNVNVLAEVTNDRQKIYKAIKKADWGNGTSLYDAVDFSLRKRLSKIAGRKAIVLFTDGVDTTSRKAGYDGTLDMAEEADALIFPIYYNTYSRNNGGMSSPFPGLGGIFNTRGSSAADYARGRQYLNELAAYTGGRVFRPEATPGGLTAAFEGIAEELRRQYNIGYIPKNEGQRGQQKQIKVRVDQPNLIIRSRDSYIVGAPAAAPTEPARSQK